MRQRTRATQSAVTSAQIAQFGAPQVSTPTTKITVHIGGSRT
jgi:hypothetical protein